MGTGTARRAPRRRPHDLTGAVIHATDDLPDMPGAQLVTHAVHARLLDPIQGDEVLDWSPTRVVADFGGGWRLRDRQ